MEQIKINKRSYYLSDKIINEAPVFAKGIRSGRDLIKKKNIDDKQYLYARLVDNKWIQCDGKSIKFDKVFIKKSYVESIEELTKELNDELDNVDGIEKAPDVIELKDNEKFQDSNGNKLEIETRGTRDANGIYFKVKDVANGFEMKHLHDVITKEKNNYEINKHYKYFNCLVSSRDRRQTNKKNIAQSKLFLTYKGMLRVLFVSKSGCADKFIDWATQILFTHQLGTPEQKTKLASDLMGISFDTVKQVLNKSPSKLSCVYLLILGTAKDLRKSMNIDAKYPDDYIICKYGLSKDFLRRLNEHDLTYGKIKDCDIRLKQYSYVDPEHLQDAENSIKEFIKEGNYQFEYENNKELFIVSNHELKLVIGQYKIIASEFKGNCSELITLRQIEDEKYKSEIALLKEQHEKQILIKDHTIESLKDKHEIALLKQEMEIMKLKQMIADKK